MTHNNGIRKGDVILSINGIPCITHEESVNIIDAATRTKTPMYFKVSRSKPSCTLLTFMLGR